MSQSGLRGVRAVGVATLNANSVKKQNINAKSEPSKCSGLAISRRRQNYAKIGVEFRCKARKGHICEDSLAYASYSSKDIIVPRHDNLRNNIKQMHNEF